MLPSALLALLSDAPQHGVRSLGVCSQPQSVWTGGDNGVVVRWALRDEPPGLTPEACLLGHAAPVVAVEALRDGCEDGCDAVVRARSCADQSVTADKLLVSR